MDKYLLKVNKEDTTLSFMDINLVYLLLTLDRHMNIKDALLNTST